MNPPVGGWLLASLIYDSMWPLRDQNNRHMKDNTYQYYAGNMVYKNDKSLSYLLFDEGLVTKTSSVYSYEYHLKDHPPVVGQVPPKVGQGPGNTRVTFQPNGNSTTTTQAAEYYPFGSSYLPVSPAGTNKYLYNGKEKQDDVLSGVNLDLYDYGARFYDPMIGRWNSVDPLAEKSRRWSPYNYCVNNPNRFIDPDGMFIDDYFNKEGKSLGKDNATTDNVRIIDQKVWDENKKVDENDKKETIDHDKGAELSKSHSDASNSGEIDAGASMDIYQHYNPTDLPLENSANISKGGMAFSYEDGIKIKIDLKESLSAGVGNSAGVMKNIFAHEKTHYSDFKTLGIDGYKALGPTKRERHALSVQINDPSYTSPNIGIIMKSIENYAAFYDYPLPLKPRVNPLSLEPR